MRADRLAAVGLLLLWACSVAGAVIIGGFFASNIAAAVAAVGRFL